MRAFKIFEHLEFERGQNPKTSMNVGMLHSIREFIIENRGDEDFPRDSYVVMCSRYGNLEYVKYLVELGDNIHVYADLAFRWSANKEHLDIMKYLINVGANIHAIDESALINAVIKDQFEVVKILLDAGADLHINNDEILNRVKNNKKMLKYLEDWMAKNESLKENINFERGQDPKDTMSIGRVLDRKIKAIASKVNTIDGKMKKTMNTLATKYGIDPNTIKRDSRGSLPDQEPSGYVSYEFTGKTYTYFIIYAYGEWDYYHVGYQLPSPSPFEKQVDVKSVEAGTNYLIKWLEKNES